MHLNLFSFTAGDFIKNSGIQIQFLVDTGANINMINLPTFRGLEKQQKCCLEKTQIYSKAANNSTISMVGNT